MVIRDHSELLSRHSWKINGGHSERDIRFIWSDPISLTRIGRVSKCNTQYVVEFPSQIRFFVDLAARVIWYQLIRPDIAQSTFDHLLNDQVLPRLIAYDGALALHGGGVVIDGRAIAIMAPTGRGKSTLSASLQRAGHSLLGDDALIVGRDKTGPILSAVYPSLRLLPDSISELLGVDKATRPMAQYSDKRNVVVEGAEGMEASAPLAALIFLADPEPHVCLRRITVAETCMSLIANSFALDPTDHVWAADNMRRASALASQVPAYALSYPRDYARLPDVHATILDILQDQPA